MAGVVLIIAPVFAVIVAGLLAGRLKYLPEGANRAIIDFVFRVAIPALLFRTTALAEPAAEWPFALWGAFFAPIAVVWALATLFAWRPLRRPAADGAVIALSACFGNLVLMGIPVTLAALGPAAATPMSLILLVELPAMWLAAAIQLRLAEQRSEESLWSVILGLLGDLVRNPIVIALVAGTLWRIGGLGLHPVPDRVLAMLGQATTPGSLFAMGLALAAFRPAGQLGAVAMIVALKIVALPLVAWIAAFHVFALPPLSAAVIVIFAAMPTGSIPYLFATRYGRDGESVSAAVGASVALSAVTLTLVLSLLAAETGLARGQ
jgi:hypothetical protein